MSERNTPLTTNEITLIWNFPSVTVKDKFILKNISGYCKPGEMLAIMGPSGAGKTTLLSLLANKKSEALQVQGQVRANNKNFSAEEFYNFGVYIYQNDILHQTLTVKETLEFVAKLKFPNERDSQKRVKKMISIFNLQKCQDTFVGGKFKKGISGGEKKRVCIAVQMIADPSLLILDEPTSGLDSSKAQSVVKMLRQLSTNENKSIIFTLHQPSSLIYQNLDRLLLLHQGRTIYQGKASEIYTYMSRDLEIVIPQSSTLSDFFMMQISQYKSTKYNHKTLLNEQNYNMKLKEVNDKAVEQAKEEIQHEGFAVIRTVRSFVFMFTLLMGREWVMFKRNPMKGMRTVGNAVLSFVMVGLIFLNGVGENRPTQNQIYPFDELRYYFIRIQGSTFVAIVSAIMSGIFSVALTFPLDREIYYKETSSKKYLPIAYLIAKILIESSAVITGTVIYAVGVFFMIGYTITLLQLVKFGMLFAYQVISLALCALVGNSLGFLTGALFKQANKASAMTPILLLPLMMFAGLYNKLDSIPSWIRWIQYISPFRYGLQSVILNEFQDEKFMTDQGIFDYKEELSANLSYEMNIILLLIISVTYFSVSFVLLKKLSSNLAP